MIDHTPPVSFARLIAYLRKSRADGEESVEEVLAKHERILQDYCLRVWNAPLPQTKILREVQSGETIASRPVMQQLIRMIQDKEVDGVLVVDLQRLSRGDLLDVGTLSQLFLYSGCRILTPTKSWDLKDEYDKKFFEMELMHGNDYLEYTKKIMGRGRERSVLDGNYIGSRAPYGYRRTMVDKRPTLEIVPAEAEVVRLIFELYTGPEHLGPHLLADRLNEMGLSSQRMDHWTPQAVRNVIHNPAYIGMVRWNRRKEVKEFRDGQIVTTKPIAKEYILVPGKHEPIISREIWDRAEEASKMRAHPSARHDRSTIVNPLSGLLVCSDCGKMMNYKLCYDHDSHKPIPPIFICSSRGCPSRGATVKDTLASLADILRSSLSALGVHDEEEVKSDSSANIRNIYATELADLNKQQERLYDFLERGVYDEETFRRRMGMLRERMEAIYDSSAALNEKENAAEKKQKFRSTLQHCIDVLSDPDSPAEITNRLLKEIISRIDYRREKSAGRRWDPTPLHLNVIFK